MTKSVQLGSYQEGYEAGLRAAAEIADGWGKGKWVVQQPGTRVRFSLHDLQVYTNMAGRGVAEDIRKLLPDAAMEIER